jgi:hypothetical protein
MPTLSHNTPRVKPIRPVIAMDHVPAKDGTYVNEKPYLVSRLFTEASGNAKLELSEADGRFLTIGLSLAPALQNGLTLNGRAINLCPKMSRVCRAICLHGTGHARVSRNVARARIAKSRLWIQDRNTFKAMLVKELEAYARKADRQRRTLVVRLNVFSDIAWEREFPELFGMFPDVRFYDYTKVASRVGRTPHNYHLTFSRSESNHQVALEMLGRGVNVAVVFEDHSFPESWHGYRVIDGTVSDLRILDPIGPRGTVVALAEKDTELNGPKYMGKRNARIKTAGFVLPTSTSNVWDQPVVLS